MFGYIVPEKPELKIKEYELFKAYYCGVCKSIAKRYGQIPRLTLTYDAAFLALLLSSLIDDSPKIKKERCVVHPINKRNIIISDDIVNYASDMNLLLTYYKLMDNREDEKSALSAAGMLVLKSSLKKIRRNYKEKCGIIEEKLAELAKLEKSKCGSMDRAAEPFAKLMEELLVYEPLCHDENLEKILRWIGYNIGKWIYILDAYDDLEKDIAKKSYNPLIYQYDLTGEGMSRNKAEIRERIEFNLTYALSEISKAYQLLEVKKNSGIVENIIFMGMLRKTEQILDDRGCVKVEKSV